MRLHRTISCAVLLALIGCESAPEPEQLVEEAPNIPTISAAPGSKATAPPPQPVEVSAGDLKDDEADEMMKQGAKSRSGRGTGGLGGVGTLGKGGAGNGAGSGAGGASSVGGLLEAKAPGWKVRLVKTDGDMTATRTLLQRKGASFDRCLSFLGKDAKKLTAKITYANNAASAVTTTPDDKTAGECIRSQVGAARLTAPSTLQLEFSR